MVLVQRVSVEHIPHFQQFKHVPPQHVLHEYSEKMGKKSEIVSFFFANLGLEPSPQEFHHRMIAMKVTFYNFSFNTYKD